VGESVIKAFEVPGAADETFVASWEPRAGAKLLRALRDDVDLRFVEIVHGGVAPAGAGPFASHPGRYEIAHEDGSPDGAGGVVLVDFFEVPDGADPGFLERWEPIRDVLAGQRGYLGTRLHRSIGPARFRFVDVARWSSPLAFARALQQPAFRSMDVPPSTAHLALYLPVAMP
jgi:heme-degrading monooxygenase HmoA